MNFNQEKAYERLKSRKYQLKFTLAYLVGVVIAHILIIVLRQEELNISNFLYGFLPSFVGGIIGFAILFIVLRDNRFK